VGMLWEPKPGNDCVIVLCTILACQFVLLQLYLATPWSSSGAFARCSLLVWFLHPTPGAGDLYTPGVSCALGVSHSAPGAVWVVALWEPATVAYYFMALLLVSSGVFVSSFSFFCLPHGSRRVLSSSTPLSLRGCAL
jgi:hypothetical protein